MPNVISDQFDYVNWFLFIAAATVIVLLSVVCCNLELNWLFHYPQVLLLMMLTVVVVGLVTIMWFIYDICVICRSG